MQINLEKKLKELHRAEEIGLYNIDPGCIGQLRDEIQTLKNKEEVMWKQRFYNSWLKDGDTTQNTSTVGLLNEISTTISRVWRMTMEFGWKRMAG